MSNDDLRYGDDDEVSRLLAQPLRGGESRTGQFSGTKALMLAVLEDGIRCYLGTARISANEAEYWINSHQRQSPFSFVVVCEVLGLDPPAVRHKVKLMKEHALSPRKAMPRARQNVRIPGRVAA